MNTGGEGGIRTPDTCYSTPDFESHSCKRRTVETRMDKRLLDARTVRKIPHFAHRMANFYRQFIKEKWAKLAGFEPPIRIQF